MDQLPPNPWLRWFTRLLGVGFVVLAGKLAWIQWLHPAVPTERKETTERVVYQQGRRGLILDARGTPMALSQSVFNLKADPVVISNRAPAFAAFCAPLLGMPVAQLESLFSISSNIRPAPPTPVTNAAGQVVMQSGRFWTNRAVAVKAGLSREEWERISAATRKFGVEEEQSRVAAQRSNPRNRALKRETEQMLLRLRQLRVLGLTADHEELRIYPHEGLAAHVLGFVTNQVDARGRPTVELGGVMGIERQYNEGLRARSGILQMHKTKQGELPAQREMELAPLDGFNLHLSIDVGIQQITEQALASATNRLRPTGIVAIVTRPQTGEILAMASSPAFNPGRLNGAAQTMNLATRMELEPGSTFKIFTYAAVLEAGKTRIDERLNGENGVWINQTGRTVDRIRDDHPMSGLVSLEDCFGRSLNTAAAKLALRVEPQRFVGLLRDFGFGEPTGLPLGREEPGRIWGPEHSRTRGGWDGLTQSRMAYGYAVRVTPIQMAMALGAVANGGSLMEPRLVRRITTSDGALLRDFPPVVRRTVIRRETADTMLRLMRHAVTDGTGKSAALAEWAVAGKTGTAKKWQTDTKVYSTEHYYGSFAGFLPVEDPQLAILVIVDEPTTVGKAYYGGTAAAPVFAEIARGAALQLAIKPSPAPASSTNRLQALNLPASGPGPQ